MQVTIEGITKVYRGPVHALRGVDLSLAPGLFGLLGPNGAGKTTLLRILAGILLPTSGRMDIGGLDPLSPAGRTALKRQLGYLPQDLGVYPDLSARDFLDYLALLKGLDNRAMRRARVSELLELVSLSDVADRRLRTYSGGMKRRVGIAQALLNDPQLLIVDEPTAGLDPEERIRFRTLLSTLGGERVVLLSTHIVEDIAQTCLRLAVLDAGRVLFTGTTADLAQYAQGRVWTVTTPGPQPTGAATVISMLPRGASTDYRVLGELAAEDRATAVAALPTLEDGYIALMQQHRALPTGAA